MNYVNLSQVRKGRLAFMNTIITSEFYKGLISLHRLKVPLVSQQGLSSVELVYYYLR